MTSPTWSEPMWIFTKSVGERGVSLLDRAFEPHFRDVETPRRLPSSESLQRRVRRSPVRPACLRNAAPDGLQ
jgi:hypothetical protein